MDGFCPSCQHPHGPRRALPCAHQPPGQGRWSCRTSCDQPQHEVPHSRRERKGGCSSRSMSVGWRLMPLARWGAQHGPLNVWPQVLATDGAIGARSIPGGARLERGGPRCSPLIYCRRATPIVLARLACPPRIEHAVFALFPIALW